jgi:WD40 repeat protein
VADVQAGEGRGAHLLMSCGFDRRLLVWSAIDGALVHELHGPDSKRHSDTISQLAPAPAHAFESGLLERALVASAADDKTLVLWDYEHGGEPVAALTHPAADWPGGPMALAWSPRGTRPLQLACATDGPEVYVMNHRLERSFPRGQAKWSGALQLWNVGAQRLVWSLRGHLSGLTSVTWAAQGAHLLTGSYDWRTRRFDARSARCVREYPSPHGETTVVEGSPCERLLLVAGDSNSTLVFDERVHERPLVRLWHDRPAGRYVPTYSQGVPYAAWLEGGGGRCLLSAGEDGCVRLWDVGRAAPALQVIRAHSQPIATARLSDDQQLLATGGDDHCVRLWALPGAPNAALPLAEDAAPSVAP